MSILTSSWVPVSSLYTGAQITYAGADYIVLEVLEQPIGGWVVIAHAVADLASPSKRLAVVFGNPVADVLLSHRVLEVGHA